MEVTKMSKKSKSPQTQIKQTIFDLGKAVHHRKSTKARFEGLVSQPFCSSRWSNKTKLWCGLSNIDDSAMFAWLDLPLDSDDPTGHITAFIWFYGNSTAFSPSFLQSYIKRLACEYYLRAVSKKGGA